MTVAWNPAATRRPQGAPENSRQAPSLRRDTGYAAALAETGEAPEVSPPARQGGAYGPVRHAPNPAGPPSRRSTT